MNRQTNFGNFESITFVIDVVVTGKGVKKGISLGLKIPVDHFFHGDNGAIKWFKNSIEKLDKCTNVEVEKCTVYFPNFFFKSRSSFIVS